MCDESPLTRIPGAWADRHPALVTWLICVAFAAVAVVIASTAHAQNAATMSGVVSSTVTGSSNLLSACTLVIGSRPALTVDACKRTITVAADVKVDDAARVIFDALRPYLAGMSRGP